MILSQQQIEGLRQRHEHAAHVHGYPVGMITDLLQTIAATRAEKKHWQRLAVRRGELLGKALNILELAREPEEEE